MMGGKNAQIMAEYQAAQDKMTKAGTEYVREFNSWLRFFNRQSIRLKRLKNLLKNTVIKLNIIREKSVVFPNQLT